MNLLQKLANKDEKISLIGLGYVGMPIAVAFAKKVNVIGFDVNKSKIELYKKHEHRGISEKARTTRYGSSFKKERHVRASHGRLGITSI